VSGVPPAVTVVYVDTLILLGVLSFMMDYLLLWATTKVAKAPHRSGRLAAGAAVGTAYFLLYYLSERGVVPYYGWVRVWPAVLATSVAMLITAFYPLSWPALFRVTGYFYFIAVSSGGAGLAAGYALGWGIAGQLAVAIGAIMIVAELGWGVVQRSLWQKLYNITLEINLFGHKVRTEALADTGNLLKDPLDGTPVVVVEHSVVARLLPEHLRPVLIQMESGDLSGISRLLTSERWSSRFRVIPFTSLGKEKGLMVGFRPDSVAAIIDGEPIPLESVIIGLYPKALDPEGVYHALIHPGLLQQAVPGALAPEWAQSTTPEKGETSHATTSS